MESNMIRENYTNSANLIDRFNNTIEGNLISYLRNHNQVTLDELIEHTVSNKNLQTKHAKKYRNKYIEKIILSKLAAKPHIFIENRNKIWTLDEIAATKYEQKKIAEIKEINEMKQKSRLGKQKNTKNKLKEEGEKLKDFDKNIFAKLEQIEEIMESSNESAKNQIIEFFMYSSNNKLYKS